MNPVLYVLQLLRAFFGLLFVFASAIPYTFFLYWWIAISYFFPVTYFHIVEDYLWGMYQKMMVFMLDYIAGVKIFMKGNVPSIPENVLVLSNHQCMYDWVITNFLALRQGMVGNMRYVFKDSIKYYPLYGFAFGYHGGVFVKRNGRYNNENMKRVLTTLTHKKARIYFLIYPEGTRFDPKRKDVLMKSKSFAQKMDLKPLHQVLFPKVKAFDCALDTLKNYVDAVYDISIIYGGPDGPKKGVRHTIPHAFSFISGAPCKHVFVDFKRIPIEEVLNSISANEAHVSEDISPSMLWLYQVFAAKDDLLDAFYQSEVDVNDFAAVQYTKSGNVKWKKLSIPLLDTFPHALGFMLCHALFLYFPLGRWIYGFIVTGVAFIGIIYGHLYF